MLPVIAPTQVEYNHPLKSGNIIFLTLCQVEISVTFKQDMVERLF
jgi:hypothetical protein